MESECGHVKLISQQVLKSLSLRCSRLLYASSFPIFFPKTQRGRWMKAGQCLHSLTGHFIRDVFAHMVRVCCLFSWAPMVNWVPVSSSDLWPLTYWHQPGFFLLQHYTGPLGTNATHSWDVMKIPVALQHFVKELNYLGMLMVTCLALSRFNKNLAIQV